MASSTIISLFGQSPIKPLQNHMHTVFECTEQLNDFFVAVCAEDWPAAEAVYNKIAELESAADDQKQDIRLHLPKSLFMPINRSDLIHLLSKQDKICNKAKDIAGVILGREQAVPKKIAADLKAYINQLLRWC